MKTLAAVITLVCSSAYALTVQDLNIPGEGAAALALNDKGQVIGTYLPDFGFLWQNGTVTLLFDILPYDINNEGIIAGQRPSPNLGPLIKNLNTGVTTPIPVPTCVNLYGAAVAISDSGFAAGSTCGQAWRYQIGGGTLQLIGCPFPRGECRAGASAVNDNGVVGGYFNYNNANFDYAFYYNGSPFLLNSAIARSVLSVNNNGVMAGLGVNGPFIFNGMQFLDVTLPKGLTGGYFRSINDAGVAVGRATIIGTNETRGIIYQNGVVTILGEQIIAANQINNSGQIAGTAVIKGQQKAVLILP
jgi:uncharacterized membrane protein